MEDGLYHSEFLQGVIQEDSFRNERDMSDFIEANIHKFCHDSLGVEVGSYIREHSLWPKSLILVNFPNLKTKYAERKQKGNYRMDFLVTTKDGERIAIECKKPKTQTLLIPAIAQCLAYATLFPNIDRTVIVSTRLDDAVPAIIEKFNLPITFIVMDKKKTLVAVK